MGLAADLVYRGSICLDPGVPRFVAAGERAGTAHGSAARNAGAAGEQLPDQPRVLVAAVRMVGNSAVKEQYIQAQLKTRKDREFDPDVVQADVATGFDGPVYDVKTYTQQTPEGVIVTFEFVESPTIRYIKYLGNRNINDKSLAKQDGIEVGDSISRYAVEEARRKIEEYYHFEGFGKTQVTILEGDKPQDGGAVFVINEGQLERIASVKFVGNTIATDERLKTQIKSKPGFSGTCSAVRSTASRSTRTWKA